MITAVDKDGFTILIDDAKKGETYYCPLCKRELIQKRGNVRCHHFAHKSENYGESVVCDDDWQYDMTPWHIEWQKRFPAECIEKVIKQGPVKHRADVAVDKTVIEFQHSNISLFDFRNRNSFYQKCGYSVIWIFDIIDEWNNGRIKNTERNRYDWYAVNKLFREMDVKNENAAIYFQFSDNDDENEFVLERVTGGYNNFKTFYTDTNNALSIPDFVERILANKPLSRPKTQSTQIPANLSIPGLNTVFELWKPNYEWMIVTNAMNGKEMLIKGRYGEMDRQNKGPEGMIIGRYSNRGQDGRYTYTAETYAVWDADKPIWKLKKAKEGLSPEEQRKRDNEIRTNKIREQEAQRKREEEAWRAAYRMKLKEEEERRLRQQQEAKARREKELRDEERRRKAEDEACLEEVRSIIDCQNVVARDHLGRHWVRCKECGKIMLDDMFTTYGGIKEFNLGVCKTCYQKRQ